MQSNFGEHWHEHFIFTTDEQEGILRAEANTYGVITLPIPKEVGGRFSVLTAVRLFPALAMGIDIDKLTIGAQEFMEKLSKSGPEDNMAWQIARTQYMYQQERGINTVVLMPYVMKLEVFATWFRQLWAESLGKNGKGILPIKAVGPADQHSQVQFYNQGKWLSTFVFIAARSYHHNSTLKIHDIEELAYLNEVELERIIKVECDATRYSLANNGRPSITIEINDLDESHLGALIVLFEVAVVYLAELLEVNAFDQPGVEAGKQYMYGLLGKQGFEDKAQEIESKKKQATGRTIEYQL